MPKPVVADYPSSLLFTKSVGVEYYLVYSRDRYVTLLLAIFACMKMHNLL